MAKLLPKQPREHAPGAPAFARTPQPDAGTLSAPARSARFASFAAALLLMLLALAAAVFMNAANVGLFQQAVDRYVVAPGILSQPDGHAFAADTLAYLSGATAAWNPTFTTGDHRIAAPDAFRAHMANVRQWVRTATVALPLAAAVALLLLALAVTGGLGKRKKRFSLPGYYTGAAMPLALAGGLVLWASIGFDGMWAWLHRTFIPDGIFNAGEEIMRLFPLQMFSSYLQPVAVTFGLFAIAVLLLPFVLLPLSQWFQARQANQNLQG